MKQSIVSFTVNVEEKTVGVEAVFDTGEPDLSSPAHKLGLYIVNNFEELLGKANGIGGETATGAGPERDSAEPGADDRGDGPKIEIVHG